MDAGLDNFCARHAAHENVTLGFIGEEPDRTAHGKVGEGYDAGEGLSAISDQEHKRANFCRLRSNHPILSS
jgi:hypothetical protein